MRVIKCEKCSSYRLWISNTQLTSFPPQRDVKCRDCGTEFRYSEGPGHELYSTFNEATKAWDDEKKNGSKQFYVQNKTQTVGNCVAWWQRDNAGYVCNLADAKVFGYHEALATCQDRGKFLAWPKEYIDGLVRQHVDIQYLDNQKCLLLR